MKRLTFLGNRPWGIKMKGEAGATQELSNTASPSYNVWNSQSPRLVYDGVDIDTFDVPWKNDLNQNLIEPGDTSAHLELPTGDDSWNLIYHSFHVQRDGHRRHHALRDI